MLIHVFPRRLLRIAIFLGEVALIGLAGWGARDLVHRVEANEGSSVYLPVASPPTEDIELARRVATLERLMNGVTRDGHDLYVDGVNVFIRSGSGRTDGTPNGAGNLIIGYNESIGGVDAQGNPNDVRTGSHMLVLGRGNSYTAYGGIVAGIYNRTSAPWASVST